MRILLVNPPRSPHNDIFDHAPEEARRFIHRKLIGPPLGLLTVAAAVPDHEVTVLDMKGEYDLDPQAPPPEELMRRWLERTRPGIVGTTCIASELNAGMGILRAAKSFDASILTVAGGLHATLCPGDFEGGAADVVCPGPSAHVFRRIVGARERGEPLEGVAGIFLAREGKLSRTATAPVPCDPAGADFIRPARDHLERWLSTYRVGRSAGPATYLFTSLGCPHRCTFCSIWPQHGGAFMQRSIESIVEELGTLERYPVVRFADANTVVDAGFARRLFDAIAAAGIRKQFVMDMRVDTAAANPQLVEAMARAGLIVVICGFESFRDGELSRYNKGTEARLIHEAVRIFHENGIMVRGNYVVPPDYGEDDFKALAAFASTHRVAYAGYTILTPFPGTAFHEEVRERIVERDLDRYNLFNAVLETRLPKEKFLENVGSLWTVREGTDVI
jgi:radical SAM superfamily enzyme YgiQ (UPF0313 family)